MKIHKKKLVASLIIDTDSRFICITALSSKNKFSLGNVAMNTVKMPISVYPVYNGT